MENKNIKILAIDDNSDNLITIQALITEAFPEAKVILALSGKEGLELAIAEDPDVILLDIVMPEMDGYEVCTQLKENQNLSNIPVVFVTALKGDKQSRIRGLEVGGDAFLAKPIDESELVAQIRAMVKIKRTNTLRTDESLRLTSLVAERTAELTENHVATLNLLEDLQVEIETRKKTEADLKMSEALYRSILNASPDTIVVSDLNGIVKMVSPNSLEVFGNPNLNEVIGKKIMDFLTPESVAIATKKLNDMFRGVLIGPEEYLILKDDGSTLDVEITSEFVRDEIGNPKEIVFAVRDISERKRNQQALLESEEKYWLLVENSPNAISIHQDGKFVYVNSTTIKMIGAKNKSELIGRPILSIVHEDSLDAVIKRISIVSTGQAVLPLEEKLIKFDGSVFYAEVAALPTLFNGKPAVQLIVTDISERKKAEQALRESEEKFREMANLLPQIVFETDLQGRLTYVNKQAYIITGYSEEDNMTEFNSINFYIPEDRERAILNIKRKLSGETFIDSEYTMIRKDGSTFPVLVYSTPKYKDLQPIGLNGIIVDISDLKEAEKNIHHIARLYAFQSHINQAIVTSKNQIELFDTICNVAIQYGEFRMGWIGKYNEEKNKIEPISYAGYDEGYLASLSVIPGDIKAGIGPTGLAFQEKKMVICNDVAIDPMMALWREEALKRNYFSSFSTPLFLKGETFGTLTLYSNETSYFNEDEKNLLWEISKNISFALDALELESERKLMEESLQDSRNELKTIYDNAPVMMCVLNEGRRIQFANNAFSELSGITEEMLKGGLVGGVIGCLNSLDDPRGCGFGPNCKKCTLRIDMQHTFTTGIGLTNIEYQSKISIGGEIRSISLLGSTALIITNETKSLLLCLTDISDRRNAELALSKSESLLRTFIDNSPFEIWARDIESVGILENKKFRDNFGSIIGLTPFTDNRIDNATLKRWTQTNNRVFEGEIVNDEFKFESNGELKDFEQIVFPIISGKEMIGIAGFNIDISDRKKMEVELSNQKQFFEQMFMQSSLSTQILDKDGWCERINPKLTQIFGVEAKHIEGKVYNIFKDEEIIRNGISDKLEKVFKEGKSIEWEVFFDIGVAANSQDIEISENKKVWFSNWAYPIFNENRKISHVIIQHSDITEQKVAQEALSESQEQLKKFAAHLQNVREEERNILARDIHDDLGQILVAMKIDLGMLKQNTLKSVNKEDYEILKNQFDELYGLLNNTLKSARQIMTDLRPEVLDLLGFIEAVNQHVKGFGIRNKITSTFINNTKGLELNSQQSVALFRIVQEALNNIAKHARATEVHVILEQQNDKIMLDITDNGVGFETSDKKKVDSYGLLGMKERVFLLNGNLIINSQIQKGTTIKVFIPNK